MRKIRSTDMRETPTSSGETLIASGGQFYLRLTNGAVRSKLRFLGSTRHTLKAHPSPLIPQRHLKAQRGYDGGKKVKGRKRHMLVDTEGLVLKAKVHSA